MNVLQHCEEFEAWILPRPYSGAGDSSVRTEPPIEALLLKHNPKITPEQDIIDIIVILK
jgi:hypothetical protein